MGPADLTQGTLSPGRHTEIPTVPDNLFFTGNVESASFTISEGIITFGSLRMDKSNVIYATITQAEPAASFWGIDASLTYDNTRIIQETSGIIDFGTTTIMLETLAFRNSLELTGATTDEATGLPSLDSCDSLSPIVLAFGGKSLDIPIQNYRWPADGNIVIGGKLNKCYLAVGDIGTSRGDGLDFVIGYNTLKHLTVVFDKENSRVGIGSSLA